MDPHNNPLALIAAEALGLSNVPVDCRQLAKDVLAIHGPAMKAGGLTSWSWDQTKAYQTLHRLLLETNNGSE